MTALSATPTPVRPQRGFTLLELMIAMTLLAIIMSLLFSGLRLASRAWDSGVAQAEATNQVHLVRDWVRRQLTQARPLLVETEPSKQQVAFHGEAQAVRFVTPLPAHRGGGGLYLLTLEAVEGDGAKNLNLRYQLFHPDTGSFSPTLEGEQVALLEGIEAAEFSYFGAETPDQIPVWQDHWEGMTQLPRLVRLDIKLPDGARADWTGLLVAPLITGDAKDLPERRRPQSP